MKDKIISGRKISYKFRDWCFLFGAWFIGLADRAYMGKLLEKTGVAIQKQEGV